MAWRVTEDDVKAIVETGKDMDRNVLAIAPFINAANALTNAVAAQDSDGLLTSDLLAQIETFLAAHFYSLRDQRLQSKSTGGASGSFQGQVGKGLESTDYGTNAIAMDITGYLASVSRSRHKVGITWLGKLTDDELDYDERSAG